MGCEAVKKYIGDQSGKLFDRKWNNHGA